MRYRVPHDALQTELWVMDSWGRGHSQWVFWAPLARHGAPAEPKTPCNVFPLRGTDAAASVPRRGAGWRQQVPVGAARQRD